ncbi:MAG: tripartite tricarboxylate transporter TctB family protein [Spirochaetales bacterium]|nr:tripartite tricarboxylate transporter TctB family protein [Spirochaetales bacterium]
MNIRTNLVSGIVFVVVGAVLLLLMPGQIVVSSTTPYLESAKAAPTLAIIIMLIGGAALVFQSIVLKKEHIVVVRFDEHKYALLMMAAITLFAGMIYFLGYIVAAIVLVLALYKFYNIRNVFIHLIALADAVFVYLLFTNVFNVRLPGIGGVWRP